MKKKPEKSLMAFRVSKEIHHEFKIYAAQKKKTISKLLEKFVIEILKIDKVEK